MAAVLAPGALIAFTGGLGAGKTAFTEGLAEGLGCTDPVSSPTFAIVKASDSTLVITSEGYCRLKEYPVLPTSANAPKISYKQNVVLATIAGLSELKTPEEVARLRGKSTNEIFA